MKRVLSILLLIVASLAVTGPPSLLSGAEESVPDEAEGSLLALLPDSTLVAAEIRGLQRRWSEVRGVAAVAAFQDRLLEGSGLDQRLLQGDQPMQRDIVHAGDELRHLAVVLRLPVEFLGTRLDVEATHHRHRAGEQHGTKENGQNEKL